MSRTMEDQITILDLEDVTTTQVMQLIADASDLRLPVGLFPREIKFSQFVGNGYPFMLYQFDPQGHALYIQKMGSLTLRILND